MKFLLFSLGITYFFIFFFLSKIWQESFFLSLFIQAQLYFAWALFFLLYTLEMKKIYKNKRYKFSYYSISLSSIVLWFKNTLKDNIYTFWIILLYVSIYFISLWLYENIYLPYIFAVINFTVVGLYFISSRSKFLYDIVRWNTIITSLFYSYHHIFFLFGFIHLNFYIIDYFNLWVISILFMLLFSAERSKEKAWIFALHALIFFLLEISIFLYFIIPPEFFIQTIIIVLSWVIHLFFYGVDMLTEKSYIPSIFFLKIGGILSYILIILWVFMLLGDIYLYSLPVFMIVCIHAFYLIRYYREFKERLSLFFWFLGFFTCLLSFFIFFYEKDFLLSYSSFIFLWSSLFVFLLPFSKSYIFEEDIYIIHIILLWVNILWVILFFIYQEFSILHIWFLLLFEAGYFIANSYLFKRLYQWRQT